MNVHHHYWQNRLYRPDDEDAVFQLTRAVYPDWDFDELKSYWRWRFFGSEACDTAILVADHQSQIVGIQPVAIFDFQWGQKVLQGAMYTGVLTHPDHRRKGIFRSLVDSTNEYASDRNAAFSMTMPNELSYPGFIRTGEWLDPGDIPMYIKVLDGRRLLTPKIGAFCATAVGWTLRVPFWQQSRPDRESGEYEQVANAPADLDDLFSEYAQQLDNLMIRRTARYWNWRYSARPNSNYRTVEWRKAGKLVGIAATSIQERMGFDFGMILDYVCPGSTDPLKQLLRSAEADLHARGAGIVACQAMNASVAQALQHAGYRCAPTWLTRKKFHMVYRPHGDERLPRLPSARNDWHLTFGDSDNT